MNPKNKTKSAQQALRVIIAGGGTGGHIFPAIAIADAIKEINPSADILFVGAKGKMEMDSVPKAGYPIKGLWISGFHRKLTLRNLLFPLKLLVSLIKSFGILWRFRPDVAIGVGGFASGPLLYNATWQNVPSLIQEQNSFPGITNRLLAERVKKICVAYPGMERFFPAERIVKTGNPVRKSIQNSKATKEEGAAHFGFDPAKPIIFVFGGSLGARSINLAMEANASLIEENEAVQVLWQYGKLYEEQFKNGATSSLPNVKAMAFIDRMDLAYAMADVIICRAGALTISELQFAGKPAIFIPSPNVAEDHQSKNAKALVDVEAAWMIPDKEAAAQIIAKALLLLKDDAQRKLLSDNIKAMAMTGAASSIAKAAIELAHSNKE
jgi:UDP-N-acetylglucosamine--N-acetylmuramyl-(pentapeptide) pyrophosphoryl-undecaprenol N-acetylglucosamine transferase